MVKMTRCLFRLAITVNAVFYEINDQDFIDCRGRVDRYFRPLKLDPVVFGQNAHFGSLQNSLTLNSF
jgi:hypothetical protein